MEENDTKTCENCKREIPAVNFTIHTLHCARNIRVCPACKEPLPITELKEHHDRLHKSEPCGACGESVCGADLEDHVRDSCARTARACRFCELELPRGDLPLHENYCGTRTEQCPDCQEFVMIKYRQLHLDCNHGFLRLDDDPVPTPIRKPTNFPTLLSANNINRPSTSYVPRSNSNGVQNSNLSPNGSLVPLSTSNSTPTTSKSTPTTSKSTPITSNVTPTSNGNIALNGPPLGAGLPQKNNNLTPNRSNSFQNAKNIGKNLNSLDKNVKQDKNRLRQEAGTSKKITLKRTNDQPQININSDVAEKVQKDLSLSRGTHKKRPAPQPPRNQPPSSQTSLPQTPLSPTPMHPRPSVQPPNPIRDRALQSAMQRQMEDERDREILDINGSPQPVAGERREDPPLTREQLQNLVPMTPLEFMNWFQELQLRKEPSREEGNNLDRFSQIKTSLRELRRGLNEVTAPYASQNTNLPVYDNEESRVPEARGVPPLPPLPPLPCEFCDELIPAEELVLHQTGCRPDLAQYVPRPPSPAASPRPPRDAGRVGIPCEFCDDILPVYLISEHQESCGLRPRVPAHM